MKTTWKILVADDEPSMRESLSAWLTEDGYQVDTAECGADAVEAVRANDYAVCFVDLKMPGGMNGIDVLKEVKTLRPETSVIIITAFATVDTAVAAMKEGAEDYIVKPFNPEEASLLTRRIIAVKGIQQENRYLRKRLARRFEFHDIISKNPEMQRIFEMIRKIASLKSTVLVLGESGTGKELVARAIHASGDRADKPFVQVACAALAETLLESELFGHEKGSFTGAIARKIGKFELADGGTIFLDEIGDIPPKLQLDLLRVLQERTFFRVGGTEEIRIDARVISATNRDLEKAVADGDFREDLYYRLNVLNIELPPLRRRREDIPLLARHFVKHVSMELGIPDREIEEDAMKQLLEHDWPGNIRELENSIERAMATCNLEMLCGECFSFLKPQALRHGGFQVPTDLALEDLEKLVIPAVLKRTGGNVKGAAEILGIDRSTLYDKLKRYGIDRPKRGR